MLGIRRFARVRYGMFAGALSLATISYGNVTSAGELTADVGAALRRSTWRDDWSGGFQLGFGYRFIKIVGIDARVWEELASVDTRLNTGLSIGLTGTWPLATVRPKARLYFVHQHEEGWVSVIDHPWGTIAGIGTGIRHRAGAGLDLGVEWPFSRKNKLEWIALGSIDSTYFPDASLGPSLYVGLHVGIGLNYRLEELP